MEQHGVPSQIYGHIIRGNNGTIHKIEKEAALLNGGGSIKYPCRKIQNLILTYNQIQSILGGLQIIMKKGKLYTF